MKVTLFDLKEKMATLEAQINADAEWIAEKAADPATEMKDIDAKKQHRDDLQKRYEMLKEQHDAEEARQKQALNTQVKHSTGNPEKDEAVKNKAAFYRNVAFGDKEGIKKTYSALGGIPAGSADFGSGSNLLPSTLSSELITEPFEQNSLRGLEQTSQVAGLEEPRLTFTIDDEDLLEDVIDAETAKEIELAADLVTYGRYKTKVKAEVADTVVYGTDTNLVSTVENGLRSALSRKEKLRAFAKSADDDHKHMSFYMVGIKGVTGTSIVAAIMAALGDLDDMFRANAKVLMRSADWYTYVQTLSNTAGELFTAKPQDVLGVPVIFNDRASIPIVGDFSYAKQNYEPSAVLDSDKDVDTGLFKYVLTAWGDHQIKLKSAFRLAIVAVAVIGGIATPATEAALAGEDLTAVGVFNTDDDNKPSSGITYLWQYDNAGTWTNLTSSYTGYNTNTLTTVNSQDEDVTFRCAITYDSVTKYTNAIKMS
jgi:HK97 family phage major capsid protein